MEVQFPPEVQELGEFKAGPGDEARISAKIRAFPDADVDWYIKHPAEEEGGEPTNEKVDKEADKKFER